MIKFLPVIADIQTGMFENHNYLPFIISQFDKYKNILTDDYYPEDNNELVKHIIDEINALYPWFLVCMVNDEPIGVVWVSHWHGSNTRNNEAFKYHSCQIHSFIDKKYWGKTAKKATNRFLDILFKDLGIMRVQMEIPVSNHKACAFARRMGFKQEGIIRCATIKNKKSLNHALFSKLRDEHLSD